MNSGMFRLSLGDLGRGLIVAILGGAVLPILAMLQTPGFDITTVSWNQVLVLAINGGLAAMAGYLMKNLVTDSNGKVLGRF